MFKLKVFKNKKIKNFEFIKKKDDFRNFYKININGDYTLIVYGYLIDYKNHKIKFPKKKNKIKYLKDILIGKYIAVLSYKGKVKNVFNDKYGEQQIFYSIKKNYIYFSNEIDKSFFLPKKYNQFAIASVLSTYGNYAFKKDSIYHNISRLSLNEYVDISNKINIKKIIFTPSKISKEFSDLDLKEYYKNFKNAVKTRLSKTTNWVFLSSGYDSSSILAQIRNLSKKIKVRAVIGRLKYSQKYGFCNNYEIERTKKIAKYYKVKLDIVNIDYTLNKTIKELEDNKKILRKNHVYNFLANNFLLLTKHIKKKSKPTDVIYNGDISDGAHNFGFSQSATLLNHPDLNFRDYADKMMSYLYSPSFFKKVHNKTFKDDLVYKFLVKEIGILIEGKKHYSNFDYIAPLFLSHSRFPLTELTFKEIIKKQRYYSFINLIKKNYFSRVLKKLNYSNIYSVYLYLYNFFHWSSGTVFSVTNLPESLGLRAATPFWDNEIQKFLSKAPENKGRGLEMLPTKYPLKYMMKHFIDYPIHLQTGPHSYLYDTGSWNVDLDLLYHSPLSKKFKNLMRDRTYEKFVDKSDLIDLSYLNKLADDYAKGKVLKGKKLFHLKGLISFTFIENN